MDTDSRAIAMPSRISTRSKPPLPKTASGPISRSVNWTVSFPVAPAGQVAFPPLESSRELSTFRSAMWTVWTAEPRRRSSAATAPPLMESGSCSNSLGLGTEMGLREKEVTRALQASSGEGLGAAAAGGGFFGAASRDLLLKRRRRTGGAAAAAGGGTGAGEGAFAAAAAEGLGASMFPMPCVPTSEQGPYCKTLKEEKSSTFLEFSFVFFFIEVRERKAKGERKRKQVVVGKKTKKIFSLLT